MHCKISMRWLFVIGVLLCGPFAVEGAEPPSVALAEAPGSRAVVVFRAEANAHRLALLDAKTRRPIRDLELPTHPDGEAGALLNPDCTVGRFSPDGGVFALLHWVKPRLEDNFLSSSAHPARVTRSLEDATVGAVYFWSVDSGKLLHCTSIPSCGDRLEFVDDGLLVAVWGSRTVVIPAERLAKRLRGEPVDALAATASQQPPVTLIDVLTGDPAASFAGRTSKDPLAETTPLAVRLHAGSRCLALSYLDKTQDLHDMLDGSAFGPPFAAGPDWRVRLDDLAGEDAGRAYAAVSRFAGGPTAELAQLGGLLEPVAEPAAGVVALLLADLDAADFDAREAAARQLEALDAPARTALREVLAGKPSLELRRRAEAILEVLDRRPLAVAAEERLALRAVTAFGLAGTDEARKQLRKLAAGAPWALVTRHARAALDRLENEGGR